MHFIRSGFRAVRENPALIFGEIAWRWAFGAASWALLILTVRTIMRGIDVSSAEVAFARSNDAYLIADAVVRILVQVLPRLAHALLILVPLLSLCWIAAATIGRAATLRSLTDSTGFSPASSSQTIRLLALNAVRALFTVATALAFFGTVFLISSQFTPNLKPETSSALMLGWMCLALAV